MCLAAENRVDIVYSGQAVLCFRLEFGSNELVGMREDPLFSERKSQVEVVLSAVVNVGQRAFLVLQEVQLPVVHTHCWELLEVQHHTRLLHLLVHFVLQ